MKKIYLLLCLCFYVFAANAQNEISPDYNFNVSAPYPVYDAPVKYYFNKGNEILSVKPWKKQLVIQKFGVEGLNLISEKKYKDFPDNYVVEGMLELQDKYYFFYSSWSGKKTKQERLYYREINFSTGAFIGEAKNLITVHGKLAGSPKRSYTNSGSFFGSGIVNKFSFLTSKDASKILIQYRRKPTVKRDTKSYDIIGVNVFNSALEKLWSEDYKMPYTERKMDILDYAVDSRGKGYMVVRVFHDDSNDDKKRDKSNYHIEMLAFSENNSEIQKSKMNLEDKFINGISLFELDNDLMVCAGFYSKLISGSEKSHRGKDLKRGNADGLFTFKLSKEGTIVDQNTYEIPAEIIGQYLGKRGKKKMEKKDKKDKAEFVDLLLKDLIINPDGSLLLIGEQTYVQVHHNFNQYGGGGESYTFHYKDMLVAKIDTSSKLAWMKKLPKRQSGSPKMFGSIYDTSKIYQGGMSYSYLFTKGNHYLIFLDNVKNIDLSLYEVPATHTDGKGGYLTAYKINDATGAVSKDNILDTRNVTNKLEVFQFSNNRVIKTADNQFVIEFYKKKKEDVLIKVEIK
ncbi:hypothetical protein [Lacinutrix sp. MEBiC02595]